MTPAKISEIGKLGLAAQVPRFDVIDLKSESRGTLFLCKEIEMRALIAIPLDDRVDHLGDALVNH